MTPAVDELDARVGETKRTVEGFVVEAGKVAEFARAVGDDDPVYRSADAAAERGFPAIPAPLTFPRVSSFPRYRVATFDLGFDPQFVLHGEHRYEYARPLFVGDRLHADTTLDDVYGRSGARGGTMTFAEFTTEYRTDDGERVVTETATAIETDGAASEESEAEDPPVSLDAPSTVAPEQADTADDLVGLPVFAGLGGDPSAPDPTPASTLAPGDTGPTVSAGPLTRGDFVRYAGASGDFNPVHFDDPYATGAGHQSVFGQGMLTAGVAAHAVADFVGLRRVRSFDVRFRSRVWPGDTVVAETSVVEEEGTLALDVTVRRDGEETVLTGRVTVRREN